jgi:two-component system response regulator AtoC
MGINRILIVDDELNVRRLLYEVVRKAGYETHTAENGLEALDKARSLKPSVILMDIKMPVMDGMEAFEIIHREMPETAIILMTAYGTVETAVEAMQRGAFDYLVKPSNVNEVRLTLERAFQMKRLRETVATLRTVIEEKDQPGPIVGRSTAMQQIYKAIGRVSQTNATVLIAGESGSGKGLIARMIHNNSSRHTEPFIEVNCGAIPDGLMESELFGHERGAFTGAVARKPGRFELADHGTLFLDEVGELPLPLQVKLLRVLQEREFERVGGTETIRVDVRVIAATNRDLTEMVRRGTFREDLYYRLKVIPIDVPPLRERKEDIPSFVDYYLRRFAAELHQERPCITNEALVLLQEYHWPGNVRELANVLERSVIMCGGVIGVEDLSGLTALAPEGMISVPYSGTLKDVLRKVEKEMILRALAKNGGNKVKTAQALDISRRALLYKLEEYGYGGTAKHPTEENLS